MTATTPISYSDNDLKNMDCLNLELASTQLNDAISNSKNEAHTEAKKACIARLLCLCIRQYIIPTTDKTAASARHAR